MSLSLHERADSYTSEVCIRFRIHPWTNSPRCSASEYRSSSTIPQDWIKIAENDLKFATDSLSLHAEFLPQICFYFQQAAEKYLKAYIIAKKLPFAKIHSLPALLKTCQKSDESFSKLTSECKFLTEFYLEERYPSLAIPSEITQEIAQKAETAARKVREFVKKKIKP